MTTASSESPLLQMAMVCRTCTRWMEAKERGLDKCTAVDECGSPIVGDTFHEYEGPITDFLRFCFICGDKATKGVAVRGHARKIGVCSSHVDFVVTMTSTTQRRLPVVGRSIITSSGEKTTEQILRERPKTLGSLMAELEFNRRKDDE